MLWVILAISSALIVSTLIYLSKKEIQRHESIEYATTLRFWMFILSFPFLFLMNYDFNIVAIVLMYIASWFNVFGYWFLFKSVKHMDLSLVSPFLNLEIVFVLTLAWWFYGESLSILSVFGLVLLVGGLMSLEISRKNFLRPIKLLFNDKYHSIVVLSALFYALFKVISRYVLKYQSVDLWQYLFLTNLFVVINFMIVIKVVENLNPFHVLKVKIENIHNLPILVALNFSQMVTEYAAYKIAPKAVFVSALKSTYTLFNQFFAWKLKKRKKKIKNVVVSVVVLIGTIMALLF